MSWEDAFKNKESFVIQITNFEKYHKETQNLNLLKFSVLDKSLREHPKWRALKRHFSARHLYLELQLEVADVRGSVVVDSCLIRGWIGGESKTNLAAIRQLLNLNLIFCSELLQNGVHCLKCGVGSGSV